MVAWHCCVGDGQARRAVRSICKQFRTRTLTTRAFVGLFTNLCMYRDQNSLVAKEIEQCVGQRCTGKLQAAMATWRRRTVRNIIHRQGADALHRWVHISNSRLLLDAWWKL